MAKIIIIAPSDADVDDAVKLLKNAGNDVDVESPDGKALLHILLGLMSPSAYGFGAAYTIGQVNPGSDDDDSGDDDDKGGKKDKGDDDTPAPKDDDKGSKDDDTSDDDGGSSDAGGGDDFNFEALTLATTVDGERILAERVKSPTSTLLVQELKTGSKTTYQLNESIFSFYPTDASKLVQRIDLKIEGKPGQSHEIAIAKSEDGKAKILVGDDLADLYK